MIIMIIIMIILIIVLILTAELDATAARARGGVGWATTVIRYDAVPCDSVCDSLLRCAMPGRNMLCHAMTCYDML